MEQEITSLIEKLASGEDVDREAIIECLKKARDDAKILKAAGLDGARGQSMLSRPQSFGGLF